MLAGLLLVAPAFAAAAPPTAASAPCLQRVLQELGWTFDHAPVDAARIDAGRPCDRDDLAAAQRAGDLRATLPIDPSALPAALNRVLADAGTRCAFAYLLGDATRRATTRLAANDGYRFSALQAGWIGFGLRGARAAGWRPIRRFGRGFVPLDSNRRAIEAFYAGRVRSECGVGRQVAQYATQAELFGDAFDRAFAAEEIVIGTFRQLHGTRSVLLGSAAGEFERDGRARLASARGRQAFAGLPGFIVHAFDRSFVDDSNNQAQNFVVHEVDASAAAALRERGGFDAYNVRNRELWELSRRLDLPGLRGFQRLFNEDVAAAHARLSPASRAVVAEMQALLADPFYAGFRVYVHPHGVRSVGWHLVRLLDRNPRTPYRIELALHNLHTTLFERWLQHRLAGCGGAAVATAAPASLRP